MKIFYAVYHDLNTEERSMEMLKCLVNIDHVDLVTYAVPKDICNVSCHLINKSHLTALFEFIILSKSIIKKIKPDIIVLHDNACSALIPFIKRESPNSLLVYDSSELYIDIVPPNAEKSPGIKENGIQWWIKNKLSSFRFKYEKKYLHQADLVFAANQERADLMKDYYHLKEKPMIFDNIHKINEMFDLNECEEKFSSFIDLSGFNILFAGGIHTGRKTLDFLKEFAKVKTNPNLILVGTSSPGALKQFNDEVASEGLQERVHYLGFVTRAELKYLLQRCQASVVIFDTNNWNNYYCASGKCFESMFEGTPIVASENPPLKRLCDEHGIGISDNRFAFAINTMIENYEDYVVAVDRYINSINYKDRIDKLENSIIRKYFEKCNRV